MTEKPIIALDFDGVIHSYERGWQDGTIYGTETPGFFRWAFEAQQYFTLIIHSSRFDQVGRIALAEQWMKDQFKDSEFYLCLSPFERTNFLSAFRYTAIKPPAFITIDDRALTFRGDWSEFEPRSLLSFKPWMMQDARQKAQETGERSSTEIRPPSGEQPSAGEGNGNTARGSERDG